GSQDTGHDWTHPALQPHYRGWDGVAASHAYNWHDAIHSGTSSCPPDSPAPCDDNGHGTHTIGIVVGDDGGTNRIGVAPGAEWIACRNMRNGAGTPATYTECFQWFMAPTDAAGQNPDPSRAPPVITNSWFCPTSEGCDVGTLELVVNNVRAAGIVVVVSAGNDGPTCSSLQWAPAIYDASFSVAAVDGTDQIAAFSSRGPVTSDGSNRLKPDIAAPGVSIRSSWPGAAYVQQSGTSMAAPHVAGVIALLLEARPDLVGDVDTIEGLVRASAVPETTTQDCGTVSGLAVPNNTFGFGRIDAFELIAGDADGDASGNVTDCLPLDGTTWQVPSPVADLRVGLAAGEAQLNWTEPSQPGSTAVTYDVLRSLLPGDFSGATCIVSSQATPGTADAEMPGDLFAYLVQTNNGCGGSIGSGGGPVGRSLPACP
ncbi:MAG: S8 family serine peptidase, partial [Acidobacteriota bacterium]